MFGLGPHAPFIIWPYAIVTIVIVALIVWVTLDERRQNKLLADLEARGIKRRSAKAAQPSEGEAN